MKNWILASLLALLVPLSIVGRVRPARGIKLIINLEELFY